MRFGPKVYHGPVTLPTNAATYPTNLKSPSGWLGSVGAILRFWQDYNGTGDRQINLVQFYPLTYDGSTYDYRASGIAPSWSTGTIVPEKALLLATFTSVLNSTINSPILTRSSGSFITDGVLPGHIISMSSATNIPFGSVVVSVDGPLQVTLDRNATATAAGFTGHASKVPLLCHKARILWGGTAPTALQWPIDGLQVGFNTVAAGTVDTSGVMVEAWPLFDGSECPAMLPRYGVAGVA